MDSPRLPKTLLEAVRYFSDPDLAHGFITKLRWPNGVACPRMGCGNADVLFLEKRRIWKCRGCQKQFSVRVGTVMEDSPLGLDKWLVAMWLVASNRNGVSSHELGRALGVTQKTAWFLLHRARLAMAAQHTTRLEGHVEVDETYVGGKPKHGNVGRRLLGIKPGMKPDTKIVVLGAIQRGGEVRTWVVPDARRMTIQPILRNHVSPGSFLYTDALRSYHGMNDRYFHQVIDHATEYVRGSVHTNSIESYWALLKRGLAGTYISVMPWHLWRYCDETAFRFNTRDLKDGERFVRLVPRIDGKRLTYKQLTGKDD